MLSLLVSIILAGSNRETRHWLARFYVYSCIFYWLKIYYIASLAKLWLADCCFRLREPTLGTRVKFHEVLLKISIHTRVVLPSFLRLAQLNWQRIIRDTQLWFFCGSATKSFRTHTSMWKLDSGEIFTYIATSKYIGIYSNFLRILNNSIVDCHQWYPHDRFNDQNPYNGPFSQEQHLFHARYYFYASLRWNSNTSVQPLVYGSVMFHFACTVFLMIHRLTLYCVTTEFDLWSSNVALLCSVPFVFI